MLLLALANPFLPIVQMRKKIAHYLFTQQMSEHLFQDGCQGGIWKPQSFFISGVTHFTAHGPGPESSDPAECQLLTGCEPQDKSLHYQPPLSLSSARGPPFPTPLASGSNQEAGSSWEGPQNGQLQRQKGEAWLPGAGGKGNGGAVVEWVQGFHFT